MSPTRFAQLSMYVSLGDVHVEQNGSPVARVMTMLKANTLQKNNGVKAAEANDEILRDLTAMYPQTFINQSEFFFWQVGTNIPESAANSTPATIRIILRLLHTLKQRYI